MTTAPGEEKTKTEDSVTFMEMQDAVTVMELDNAARSVSLEGPQSKEVVEKCPSIGQHLDSQCHPDSPNVFCFACVLSLCLDSADCLAPFRPPAPPPPSSPPLRTRRHQKTSMRQA